MKTVTRSRSLVSARAFLLVPAMLAGLLEVRESLGQVPPPSPAAPVAPEPVPLGPDDRTELVAVPDAFLRRGNTAQIVGAIRQASGSRVSLVPGARALVITGTEVQILAARNTLERLSNEAERANAADQAEADAGTTGRGGEHGATTINVDFEGGSVLAYLQALGTQASFESFIVPDPRALEALMLPSVKLRDADLRTAVDIITSSKFRAPAGGYVSVNAVWVGPAAQRTGDEQERLNVARSACIVTVPTVTQPGGRSDAVMRTVFDLAPLKEASASDIQSILDAITVAIEMDDGAATFQAKYHEPSRLLIVRGTPQDVDLVREIVRVRVPKASERLGTTSDAPPPAPLSEERISTMSKEEATSMLTILAQARQKPSLDEATKERLRREFELVLLRRKTFR